MDNNNIPNQPKPVVPPQQPIPQANPAVNTPTPTTGGSNKIILWFVLGLVVIAVVVGAVYFYLSKQQAAQITQSEKTVQPVVQASLKPEDTVDALDRDLQSVNVGSSDSDFATIDQDLQNL